MNTNSYHVTTPISQQEIEESEKKAKSQDEIILELFKTFENLGLTPERALRHLKIMEKLGENRWANTPVTSIRRSFSNLQKRGLIEKSETCLVKGDYGKRIHTWKLVKNND